MRKKTGCSTEDATNPHDAVYVKLPNGETVPFYVSSATTIGTLSGLIAEAQGMSENRVSLKYSGKTLNKSHSMAYLGVRQETVLKVQILEVKRITVNVNCPGDKQIEVSVENISSLRHITDAIELQLSIPAEQQLIKLRDRVLRNLTERCVDAGITDNCTLSMEVVTPSEKKTETFVNSATNEPEFDKEAVLHSFNVEEGRNIEVAFSFDTTGSMYSCLEQVRLKLRNTVTRLIESVPHMRIALIAHGDYCDHESSYVINTLDFTNDVSALVDFAKTAKETGGGDSPECYEWVLREASTLDWSEDSAKALVVIGDDIPHPPTYTDQHVFWKHEMQLLKANGVKIYGVRALNVTPAKPFYEMLSEYTGGAYIEFNNFNVITEMFLAVCYKMAGNEQFNDFCEEVEQAVSSGQVTNDVMQVLQQIEKADDNEKEAEQHDEIPDRWHIKAEWWDPDSYRSQGHTPQYSYDNQTRKWSYTKSKKNDYVAGRYIPPSKASPSSPKPVALEKKSKRTHRKKGCSIM